MVKNKRSKSKSFYYRWVSMKQRCFNEKLDSYKNYGGRGITVCDRWLDFKNFYEDMYVYYKIHCEEHGTAQTTLERKNVNGNYEPDNCTWATWKQQSLNRRPYKIGGTRITKGVPRVLHEYMGKKKSYYEWSSELGVDIDIIRWRAHRGLPLVKSSKNRIVNINGETLTLRQASEKYDISYSILYKRHIKGITDESILINLT